MGLCQLVQKFWVASVGGNCLFWKIEDCVRVFALCTFGLVVECFRAINEPLDNKFTYLLSSCFYFVFSYHKNL